MIGRKDELQVKVKEISTSLEKLDKEIEELSVKKTTQQTSKDELQNQLTELKVVHASKQQVYENQKRKLNV